MRIWLDGCTVFITFIHHIHIRVTYGDRQEKTARKRAKKITNLNPVNIRKILHKLRKRLRKKKILNILLVVMLE